MKRHAIAGLAAALLASGLAACDGGSKGEPAPPESAPPSSTAAAETTVSAAEPPGSEPAAPESGDPPPDRLAPPPLMPFGVPECDNFVRKFVACVDLHVPADRRGGWMDELNENREKWREMARLQQAAVAQGLACRSYAQKVKGDLAVDYGCEF